MEEGCATAEDNLIIDYRCRVVPLNLECEPGALLELTMAEKAGTVEKVTAVEPVAPTTTTTPSPTTTTTSAP